MVPADQAGDISGARENECDVHGCRHLRPKGPEDILRAGSRPTSGGTIYQGPVEVAAESTANQENLAASGAGSGSEPRSNLCLGPPLFSHKPASRQRRSRVRKIQRPVPNHSARAETNGTPTPPRAGCRNYSMPGRGASLTASFAGFGHNAGILPHPPRQRIRLRSSSKRFRAFATYTATPTTAGKQCFWPGSRSGYRMFVWRPISMSAA